MSKFEKVSRFDKIDIKLPARSTQDSAGYDMYVAEDIIIPPYKYHMAKIQDGAQARNLHGINEIALSDYDRCLLHDPLSLDEASDLAKGVLAKPSLISTGVKCQLEPGTYLELSVRSSTPLKYWLILANSVGIIDADYYNNKSNEGEIFFQVINLFPYAIRLNKGDKIGQGIIKSYRITEDDNANGVRTGGFGSTN